MFPLICNISISPNAQAGKRTSQLYFSNIIGSILGSFVIGYLLMDFFSTAQVSLLLVATGVLAGLTLLVWGERPQWRTVAMLSLVSVVVVVGLLPTFTHLYLRLLPYYPVTRELQYLIENKSGVVAVLADRTVIGAGAYEGTFNTDPLHDQNGIFRAYALSVLHPAPKKVLQIGLATGSWAQVIVNNPSVEQLTIVEINPAYLSLIPKYPEVKSLLSNPKVKIEIDDARRWFRRHPETFDAVVMNTFIHSHANATNLLSREYLELVKHIGSRGGIFYYNTTDSASAQTTAATVFPDLVRVWNFVAVSESPIVLDKERWLNTMREYTIDGHPCSPRRLQRRMRRCYSSTRAGSIKHTETRPPKDSSMLTPSKATRRNARLSPTTTWLASGKTKRHVGRVTRRKLMTVPNASSVCSRGSFRLRTRPDGCP